MSDHNKRSVIALVHFDDNSLYLTHYGRKGMEWGKHKFKGDAEQYQREGVVRTLEAYNMAKLSPKKRAKLKEKLADYERSKTAEFNKYQRERLAKLEEDNKAAGLNIIKKIKNNKSAYEEIRNEYLHGSDAEEAEKAEMIKDAQKTIGQKLTDSVKETVESVQDKAVPALKEVGSKIKETVSSFIEKIKVGAKKLKSMIKK